MKSYLTIMWGIVLITGIVVVGQSAGIAVAQDAKIEVVPAQVELSPALIKEPVAFKG
ncbi:MAG: hypothetical protein FJY85_19595, partial [Deltaproteobacteria bacterium]|nr:hypothetical protein [Deltaproteobacteria bacterium]